MTKVPDSVFEWSKIVLQSVQDLREKKVSVSEVKAVIAGINSVQAGLALRQEQARLTGALVSGDVIMDLKNDPNAEASPASRVLNAKAKALPVKATKAKAKKKKAA